MALSLDFEICLKDNCTKLSVTDKTGAYEANTNTTGWGSPNLAGSAITTATITIGTQEETVTATIPDTPTQDFTFPDITLDATADGSYDVTYEVTDGTTTISETKTFFLDCAIQCCIYKKVVTAIDVADCNCDQDISYELFLLTKLAAMQAAADGCDFAKATTYLTDLQKLCTTSTSDCGCS